MITQPFDAGAAAGHRWAKAWRNGARLERLRGCPFDYRNRFSVYACYLTDRSTGPKKDAGSSTASRSIKLRDCPRPIGVGSKAGRVAALSGRRNLSKGSCGARASWPHLGPPARRVR
jgi:hypothetical protein